MENVRTLLAQGKLKEADQACRERPCPLSFVIVSGIAEVEYGWPAVEKALEDSSAEQAARLYRKLEYLSVIGNLAPMIGLLGTVSGMILAFREVAVSSGSAGAADLASGIILLSLRRWLVSLLPFRHLELSPCFATRLTS